MSDTDDFLTFFTADQDDDPPQQQSSKPTREQRLQQTESAFLAQLSMWRPVCAEQLAKLRIRDDFTTADALELKAAAEERYFVRDYEAAVGIARKAVELGGRKMHPLELEELRELVEVCGRKMEGRV
ncbi:hypothetical protein EX30DRAFT_341601 [Ascodesmis nigricans]|uniref:Uncharacterized protein n=1 Tax=Ascodesmis nigricans TaxID=341454 RepID=A0A4S2MUU0_9PEZI|nr:hypothetical protein EX30DRAFT_341601 [Ascodesmis nigricans]